MSRVYDDRMKRKKLEGVRVFVRDLFINGFRDRDGLNVLADNKTRAADENRQIIASILREYYKFEKRDGDRYFIAIDTRNKRHNPIHNIWKTKSFSGSDIVLHFFIMDYLKQNEGSSLEVTQQDIFSYLKSAAAYDDNDKIKFFRKKDGRKKSVKKVITKARIYDTLSELTELGLISRTRCQEGYSYSIEPSFDINNNILDFASEVMPISTIGSYLLDRQEQKDSLFAFKHNMISQVLDDEIMFLLFEGIAEKREIVLDVYSRVDDMYSTQSLVPLFIMRNVQTGRQYVACWHEEKQLFKPVRLDYISLNINNEIKGKIRSDYDELKASCKELYKHSWGVNIFYINRPLSRVSFTIQIDNDSQHVAKRMLRERRNGQVDCLGDGKYRFYMDLYDPIEIIPWITTFYGYIVELVIEDEEAREKLKNNFRKMLANHLDEPIGKEVLNA